MLLNNIGTGIEPWGTPQVMWVFFFSRLLHCQLRCYSSCHIDERETSSGLCLQVQPNVAVYLVVTRTAGLRMGLVSAISLSLLVIMAFQYCILPYR